MTHEELLARLSIEQGCPVGDALRAVVELHKPDGGFCNHCEEGFIMGSIPVVYPCPTIHAIEKGMEL